MGGWLIILLFLALDVGGGGALLGAGGGVTGGKRELTFHIITRVCKVNTGASFIRCLRGTWKGMESYEAPSTLFLDFEDVVFDEPPPESMFSCSNFPSSTKLRVSCEEKAGLSLCPQAECRWNEEAIPTPTSPSSSSPTPTPSLSQPPPADSPSQPAQSILKKGLRAIGLATLLGAEWDDGDGVPDQPPPPPPTTTTTTSPSTAAATTTTTTSAPSTPTTTSTTSTTTTTTSEPTTTSSVETTSTTTTTMEYNGTSEVSTASTQSPPTTLLHKSEPDDKKSLSLTPKRVGNPKKLQSEDVKKEEQDGKVAAVPSQVESMESEVSRRTPTFSQQSTFTSPTKITRAHRFTSTTENFRNPTAGETAGIPPIEVKISNDQVLPTSKQDPWLLPTLALLVGWLSCCALGMAIFCIYRAIKEAWRFLGHLLLGLVDRLIETRMGTVHLAFLCRAAINFIGAMAMRILRAVAAPFVSFANFAFTLIYSPFSYCIAGFNSLSLAVGFGRTRSASESSSEDSYHLAQGSVSEDPLEGIQLPEITPLGGGGEQWLRPGSLQQGSFSTNDLVSPVRQRFPAFPVAEEVPDPVEYINRAFSAMNLDESDFVYPV